ncbi:AEC family transporter [Neptuniibacter pectenicola]|jgi:predicted permease|uniref:AEC family transporter n=1 Tax=Neptuniibacter pectenicola TaxID=1806669 RepID=UPI00082D6C0D|nr:AEC family transporter [Neptuniibacter pectenicola]
MIEIISALWPVFALILLGYVAKRAQFPGEAFWRQAEKATYFILFPILLVTRLSTTDMSVVDLGAVGLTILLMVFIASVLAFIVRLFTDFDAAGFTSLYQGSVRFNVYVGLAASATLYGSLGLAVGAVVMAIMIPLLNLCCVLVFSVFTHKTGNISSIFLAITKNPLIISSLLGLLLNQTGVGFPVVLEPVADLLSRMALPLGLLSVGAGLSFRVLVKSGKEIGWASFIKLGLMPIVAFALCAVLALDVESAEIIWLYAALPTATSSYILARQLGGDAPMMAAIITGQTLISMISIPVVLIFLSFLQKSL